MKVMYVCSYTGLTGATQVMLSNIESLKSKVEFLVILPGHGPLEDELKVRGIEVLCLKYFNWIIPNKIKIKKSEKIKWYVKKIINLYSNCFLMMIILSKKVDIVQINTLYTNFGYKAGRLLKRKVIWYAQEVPEGMSNMSFWHKSKAVKELQHADGIICVSNFVCKYILDCGVSSQRVTVIYNSVKALTIDQTKSSIHDPIRISVIAGVANYQKNQLVMLQTLKKLVNANYRVVLNFFGIDKNSDDKEYIVKMEKYINDNELINNVRFHGFVNDKERIYGCTDITVSCAVDEAFGLTVVESMARQIPVVVVKSGGTGELINNSQNGGSFEENDSLELVNQLREIINNSKLRLNYIKKAKAFVETECNPEKIAKDVLKFYSRVNRLEKK